jgi:hypothetical protein
MTDDRPYEGGECKAFHGRALVVLQISGTPEQIAIRQLAIPHLPRGSDAPEQLMWPRLR